MNRLLFTLLVLLTACAGYSQSTEAEQDMFETMRDGDKAVVVAVHAGADDAASQQSIDRFNGRMRRAYPTYAFREAWTSREKIRQLASNGVSIMPTPDELFVQLHKDGFTHVLVQSSNIVNGTDMQYLRHVVETTKEQFKQMRLGEPLLSDVSDYEEAARVAATSCGNAKEANLLVCDATSEAANAQYTMLDYTLHEKGFKSWFVGATGGYPSPDSVVRLLKSQKVKKVHLIPFVFAASRQELSAITDEWTRRLQQAGCKVTTEANSLDGMDAIIDIFERHIRHAEKYRKYTAKEMKLMR